LLQFQERNFGKAFRNPNKTAQRECAVQIIFAIRREKRHGARRKTKIPPRHIGIMTPMAANIFCKLFFSDDA
jgi:hypothetical protein